MTDEQEALELVDFKIWFFDEFEGEEFNAIYYEHSIAYSAWMARAAKSKGNTK